MTCKKYKLFLFLAHSSALVGNKLYFFGGERDDGFCTNEVFYLDASQSFNLVNPPWVDLTLNAGLLFRSCWATVSFNYRQQIIYLFGGRMYYPTDQNTFISNVHSFNLNSSIWSIPDVEATPPKKRLIVDSVIDNTGKMYIFGGFDYNFTNFNDMVIFDTVALSWLISGMDDKQIIDISVVYLYDTNSLNWSVKVAKTSSMIEGRVDHTAVLAPDGKIIIYGGSKYLGNTLVRAVPELFIWNQKREKPLPNIPTEYDDGEQHLPEVVIPSMANSGY
ncbi:3647_t:CDS:2 [Funneliformis geosporum]|uniref:3647_t:CDS:1 n=1 Tax=Funneliformis geosporum TaxID=1117311 RepID=A0A9W4SHA6_9GLOM|nr:3647_t:CDS:2 [Funneliformis geosporum]